jgi:hypothetical protein
MTDPDLSKYGMEILPAYARHLDNINTIDSNAKARYELLSGALIWPDETNRDTPVEVIWELRQLWAYRTWLIRNKAEPDIPIWEKCVALFPNWIGFRPERRMATPELLAEYRRGAISTRWGLRQLERREN